MTGDGEPAKVVVEGSNPFSRWRTFAPTATPTALPHAAACAAETASATERTVDAAALSYVFKRNAQTCKPFAQTSAPRRSFAAVGASFDLGRDSAASLAPQRRDALRDGLRDTTGEVGILCATCLRARISLLAEDVEEGLMTKTSLRIGAILTAGAVLLAFPSEARAIGPIDVEAAGRVGFASSPLSGGGPNPMGFGLGVRGGMSVYGFYGGVSLMYYLGGSQYLSPGASDSFSTLMYGVEFGYTFKLPAFVRIRPQVGFGNWKLTESGFTSNSNSDMYIEPGVVAEVSFGPLLVGVDVNALFLPGLSDCGPTATMGMACVSNEQAAFTAHGQVGVKF